MHSLTYFTTLCPLDRAYFYPRGEINFLQWTQGNTFHNIAAEAQPNNSF